MLHFEGLDVSKIEAEITFKIANSFDEVVLAHCTSKESSSTIYLGYRAWTFTEGLCICTQIKY
jgi:hypothetical protein